MTLKTKVLLIDCGNTYLKWCLSDADILTEQQKIKHKGRSILEIYKALVDEQSKHCNSLVLASVLGESFSASAKKITEEANITFLEIQSHQPLSGISSAYDIPENLGNDRWVAMIGALALMEIQMETAPIVSIVIDSGTATTIDAINQQGKHLGGVILPGLALSLSSLSNNTELLPDLSVSELSIDESAFSKSTDQAIKSGCLLGLAGAIDGICDKMQKQLNDASPSLTVKRLLCGGSAKVLLPHLKRNNYEHHESLLMLGLQKAKEISAND